ncbi:MAG: hypothetical protein NTAFB05_08640 [Nitrobacter sp.]|uniref:hypothetical protein n=1 Tax=Nitrobacter sp. TaxID=29420 RepID=UPI00387DE11B
MLDVISALYPDCKLLSGVRNWNPEKALAINSGVTIQRATKWELIRTKEFSCHTDTGVYIPKDDWRCLTGCEVNALIGATDDENFATTIQIFQIPVSLLERGLRSFSPYLDNGLSRADSLGFMAIPKSKTQSLIDDINRWLRENIISVEAWHNNGMGVVARKSGYLSSTGWGGLHVDLWGPTLSKQIQQTYNGLRCVINFSSEPRRFVFQNLRMATLSRMYPDFLTSRPLSDVVDNVFYSDHWQRLVGDRFVEEHRNYPIISVLLEPGHGYLAPTTSLFHDGCLSGMTQADITVRAGHSGFTDVNHNTWTPPEFSPEWRKACLKNSHALVD